MNAFRRIALFLLALVPLLTLVFKNDRQEWDFNRSLMVAPDEFSYMLTAQNILAGKGISTQATLGLDTFYPPGYPLMIAGWARVTNGGEVTPLNVHVLNALLLSAATLVVYRFSRRLISVLAEGEHARFAWSENTGKNVAVLVAGIFATNWHVLETALFALSEPAFMLVTLAWLAAALRWRNWHQRPLQTVVVALLAIAAWSIRGAGLVCIVVTCLYPVLSGLKSIFDRKAPKKARPRTILCLFLIIFFAFLYQFLLFRASPEKSLFAKDTSSNSYMRQLVNGVTRGGELRLTHPGDWGDLTRRVSYLAKTHLDDFASSFVPWLRDPPDLEPRYVVGRVMALLALAGFLRHLARGNGATRLLDMFVVGYFGLYLLWPFNMTRFWSPILPIMLVFAADAVRQFSGVRRVASAAKLAGILFGFLLILSVEEIELRLESYQRRLNYVSAGLADAASAVVKRSGDPAAHSRTLVAVAGDDEHFVFAWYFNFARLPGATTIVPMSPRPHVPPPSGPREPFMDFLISGLNRQRESGSRLFVIRYFTEPNYPEVYGQLMRVAPQQARNVHLEEVFRRGDVVTVWEVVGNAEGSRTLQQ